MAEGAPLLREYRVYSSIGGSNPPFSAIFYMQWVKDPLHIKNNESGFVLTGTKNLSGTDFHERMRARRVKPKDGLNNPPVKKMFRL